MKKNWGLLAALMILMIVQAQQNTVPMKEWKGNTKVPFILFFSGDGGLNTFSSNLCSAFANKGYGISAVDSKKYFWNKKSPQQLATDMTIYLHKILDKRPNTQFVIAGFSFGADAVPFLVNRLPGDLKNKLYRAIMIEPSTSTDLEIHLADMVGRSHVKRSLNVIAEINKIENTQTLLLMGNDTRDFPSSQLITKHLRIQVLKGDHHFDGHEDEVANAVISELTSHH
ncbi:bacterial virulence protein (VirJ) [Sphingobacterium spiritivorum ATCC 33300]|uniref:Bacterial virulence protein (VirJ) n=1 Tax=Sphingobacterium spiritivorum ATCC 33300 TaxID=525372 RepID=C2G1C8_SPHSI|nr:AcvB/VirJ family lysyl-phosphatidylglycerol hydrolase [Sphingobacterium spiritivorum]EEI90837.1 bacterial virulence protein (VirJ) [Sphingobacterium spiritivorum ATCC 33300]QQS97731.1 virulence protein [Sphingobacterium spiritivorum]